MSLEILKQCSSNLAPEQFITTESKCHANSFDAAPVLIKTEFHSFSIHLKQGPFNPANLMMRVKTIWEPYLLQAGPSVPL